MTGAELDADVNETLDRCTFSEGENTMDKEKRDKLLNEVEAAIMVLRRRCVIFQEAMMGTIDAAVESSLTQEFGNQLKCSYLEEFSLLKEELTGAINYLAELRQG